MLPVEDNDEGRDEERIVGKCRNDVRNRLENVAEKK